MEGCAVIAFARAPVLGQLKTRLAAGIGEEFALLIYKQCAECVLQEAARCGATAFCFHPNTEQQGLVTAWLEELELTGMRVAAQADDPDLGARMLAALQHVRGLGFTKALVVGTDVPDITVDLLQLAFTLLETNDVVFGPAHDGGYYLVGMQEPQRSVFVDVPWSAPDTLKRSIQNAQAAGLSVCPSTARLNVKQVGAWPIRGYEVFNSAPQPDEGLPVLQDIDTKRDLELWNVEAGAKESIGTPVHPLRMWALLVLD